MKAWGRDGVVYTPYAELVRSARPGDRLLLDDGRIELRVTRLTADELVTTVVTGGSLGQNKGINAPGVALPASAITEKDAADLRFGLELGVDYVALSFVQTADDLRRARQVMAEAGGNVPLIAKIERPAAVQNLGRDSRAVARRDGGARRSRARDAARAGPARAEGSHPPRPGCRPSGDRRDPGARVDAGRSAAHAGRGQRCGQRGGRGGRRDHAGGGDGRRRVAGEDRPDARHHHARGRARAVGHGRVGRGPHRQPSRPRTLRSGGDAGDDRAGRRDRRSDARGEDRAGCCRPCVRTPA